MKKFFLICSIVLFCNISNAQVSIKDSAIHMVITSYSYGAYLPAGDMAKRFGWNSIVSGSVDFKWASNWSLGLDGGYLFGSIYNGENIFRNLMNEDGGMLDVEGKYADVRVYERGWDVTMNLGKLFPIGKPNKNSGIIVKAGAGFLQHKLRIDVIGNSVPYLDNEYKKGYDRLTNGLTLHQFFGYQYLSNKHLINFFLGVDCYEAFTQNRRSYNYDDMMQDKQKRLDMLFGLRAGWILPLYKKVANDIYFK